MEEEILFKPSKIEAILTNKFFPITLSILLGTGLLIAGAIEKDSIEELTHYVNATAVYSVGGLIYSINRNKKS